MLAIRISEIIACSVYRREALKSNDPIPIPKPKKTDLTFHFHLELAPKIADRIRKRTFNEKLGESEAVRTFLSFLQRAMEQANVNHTGTIGPDGKVKTAKYSFGIVGNGIPSHIKSAELKQGYSYLELLTFSDTWNNARYYWIGDAEAVATHSLVELLVEVKKAGLLARVEDTKEWRKVLRERVIVEMTLIIGEKYPTVEALRANYKYWPYLIHLRKGVDAGVHGISVRPTEVDVSRLADKMVIAMLNVMWQRDDAEKAEKEGTGDLAEGGRSRG